MENCENCKELMEKVVRMDNNLEKLRGLFDENVDISNGNFDNIWENFEKIDRFMKYYQRRQEKIELFLAGAFLTGCYFFGKKVLKKRVKNDENCEK